MTVHRFDHEEAVAVLVWFFSGVVMLNTLIAVYRLIYFPL